MYLDLCVKITCCSLYISLRSLYRMQYRPIRLLLFYSVIFQSVIFSPPFSSPSFSSPADSTPATSSVIFQSCKFQSCKFSYPLVLMPTPSVRGCLCALALWETAHVTSRSPLLSETCSSAQSRQLLRWVVASIIC